MNLKVDSLNDDLILDDDIFIKANEEDSFTQLEIGKAFYSDSQLPGNYEKAFNQFMLAAQERNMEAQFRLGDFYACGQFDEKDEFTAYDWYMKSAIQGYPKALTRIHNIYHAEKSMYCRGQRNAKEEEWTLADFKKENHIRELYEYRVQHLESKLTKIRAYFEKLLTACREQVKDKKKQEKQDDTYLTLGFLYQHGYGIRKITSRAIEFYTLAAEHGNADAEFNLGYIYHHGANLKWNYRKAFNWYNKAAENRNSSAQEGLAYLYLKGLGTDVNYPEALYWYNRAATEGRNVNAMISLASIYRKGEIVLQDNAKVVEWYNKAIREGSTVAQSSLETLYHRNDDILAIHNESSPEKTPSKIYSKKGLCSRLHSDISNMEESVHLEHLKKTAIFAMRGDGHAMLDIGRRYLQGTYFFQDDDLAFKWIRNAAKAGLNEARCMIAKIYVDGNLVDQNYHKASIWYRKAAKAGDDKAQFQLGLLYHHGLGVRKDPLEASRWYTFAAEKNNSDAQCQLGILRESGEGLTQDGNDALKWFSMAVKQKNPLALHRLAKMYQDGGVLKIDDDKAFFLNQVAAKLGNLESQFLLIRMFEDDDDDYYNPELAVNYYKMAADNGNAETKYKLAILYLNGQGIKQDLIQAYYLFKESSKLGYENANNIFNVPIDYSKSDDIDYEKIATMFVTVCTNGIDSLEYNLGRHYSVDSSYINDVTFESIDADTYLMKTWYSIAAEKGNPNAQYELGVFYEDENGKTSEQNLSNAMEYYELAYTNGSVDAAYKLACMYLYGYGYSQDFKKAFCLLNEAADMGHKGAYRMLNSFNEDEPKEKVELIKEMLEISAQYGNIASQYKVGLLHASDHRMDEAVKWLQMASEGGLISASFRLASFLENEDTIPDKDYQKIIQLYQLAGRKGHKEALFRLAQLFLIGTKVERHYSKAFEYYTLAVQEGYQPAQAAIDVSGEAEWESNRSQLTNDYDNGGDINTTECGYKLYFQMWEHIADKGNVDLQYKLGAVYEKMDTYSSLSEAAEWYSKAARVHHDLALYRLGRLYELGRGVGQEYKEAIKYYKISSELGNTQALYQLGVIHQHGRGVTPDFKKAISYYAEAAKKGYSKAQFTLGQLFEEGSLIPKDIFKALKWYSISNALGNTDAQHWLSSHYDEAYSNDYFYHRELHILHRVIEKNESENHQNDAFLGSVYYKLGLMHFYGQGTPIDYKEALQYFRNATMICSLSEAIFFSYITFEDVDISIKDQYTKKLEMFEATADQLTTEELYELGTIFYHGVRCLIAKNQKKDEAQFVIHPDHTKSSKYFKMILGMDLSDDELYSQSSYFLGMVYVISNGSESTSKAHRYLHNAVTGGNPEADAFLNYITNQESDNEVIFKKVFEWHIENKDSDMLKLIFNIGWFHHAGIGTEEDYTQALYYYTSAGERNYVDAQIELGYMYHEGIGTDKDPTKSIEWYMRAANQKSSDANYTLGDIYFYGKGVSVDYKRAVHFYKSAADKEDRDAQYQLGCIYENGYGVNKDVIRAIHWYTRSANQRHCRACVRLGEIYFEGYSVARDHKLTFKYYTIAADEEYDVAQCELAVLYEYGYGVEKDFNKAIELYIKSGNQNNNVANYNLGIIYLYNEGVNKDKKLAFQHFKKAADNGYVSAKKEVGICYDYGIGVDRDDKKAIEWYTKAANGNDIDASNNLGRIYFNGDGVEKDYDLAIQFYTFAADRGNDEAQAQLGTIYFNGYGVAVNYSKAIEWYTEAANQNHLESISELGYIYLSGLGVDADYKLAFHHFTIAANQGHSVAQHNLGVMYENGNGVKKDTSMAIEWYTKAANQNHGASAHRLGTIYYFGVDVTLDYKLAFKYYKAAAEVGDGKAQNMLGRIYEHGQGVEKNMSMAIEWYIKSANQNNIDASHRLGEIYEYDTYAVKDRKLASKYFKIAADQGQAKSQIALALMYYHGDEVEQNYKKVEELCLACSATENNALLLLGEIYHSATIGSQDFSKAFEYYSQTREDTNKVYALRGIGLLYEYGDGVKQDYGKALDYYKQSADGGNKGAYYNIALLYYHGRGVSKDGAIAFEWFNRLLGEELIEGCTHVFIQVSMDSFCEEIKKYSIVSEAVLYGEAHYYLGIMYYDGVGTFRELEKALHHFKIASSYGIAKTEEYLDILNISD